MTKKRCTSSVDGGYIRCELVEGHGGDHRAPHVGPSWVWEAGEGWDAGHLWFDSHSYHNPTSPLLDPDPDSNP